jgi:hypothetical protein
MIKCTTFQACRGLRTYRSGEDCFWAPLDVGVAEAVHRVGCIKLGIHQTDLIGVDRRPWSAVIAVPLLDLGRVVGSGVGFRCQKCGTCPKVHLITIPIFNESRRRPT